MRGALTRGTHSRGTSSNAATTPASSIRRASSGTPCGTARSIRLRPAFVRARQTGRGAASTASRDATSSLGNSPLWPWPSAWHWDRAGLAEAVRAWEARRQETDEERGWEADDVQVAAPDALDRCGAQRAD